MGNLKCGISQKRLIVERNGRTFGTRGTTVHICRVLLMPDSLSLVWVHSVHFAKFSILRFSNTTSPAIFIGSHPNCMSSLLTMQLIAYHEGYYSSWQSAMFYQLYGTLKF